MNKEEILVNLKQIKNSLEELETQRDSVQILCIKSELELSLDYILRDYKRVLKENEEKNKIIDLMIKVMIDSSICDYFIKENCKNYAGENRKICDDCIKEYFENKVKEVK